MRFAFVLFILLSGCCHGAPTPTPIQRRAVDDRERPEDMIEKMIQAKLPAWAITNYGEWIRWGYDHEAPRYGR